MCVCVCVRDVVLVRVYSHAYYAYAQVKSEEPTPAAEPPKEAVSLIREHYAYMCVYGHVCVSVCQPEPAYVNRVRKL